MKYTLPLLCCLCWSYFGHSQSLNTPTLSPFSKISQEIGLTEVTLEYARPSAKGRVVFGELVPYGKLWRTGANASTKIILTEPVYIGAHSVAAGTYALYTIPDKEAWTIILHANTKMRSIAGDAYNPADDVLRLTVQPQRIDPYVETFTIQFAALQTDSFHLQLAWEHTLVNIPIAVEVDQKIEQQMAELMKKPEDIPHRTYFEAAQYYLNNDKDLGEALTFIDAALAKSPNNFRYGLLKAKIQHQAGDRKAALATVEAAHQWAKAAENANYMEQTTLFKQSLLEKK